jgi:hypothetical protein
MGAGRRTTRRKGKYDVGEKRSEAVEDHEKRSQARDFSRTNTMNGRAQLEGKWERCRKRGRARSKES